MEPKQKSLFDTYTLGDLKLSNRIVMASMTRQRCDPKTSIPNDLMANYYAMRGSAGLILTECTPIDNQGNTYPGAGGLWTKEQVEGWKKVTDGVHAKGSKIFVQIWHGGRTAKPDQTGEPNIGPSPLPMRRMDKQGNETFGTTPIEMTLEHIAAVVEQFRKGAINAKDAGFDGVELHGANGYLVDQFLRDGTNQRTDKYGGSIENRSRFCLEVIDALISVFGTNRVGIKLSPVGRYNDMYDSDPLATYTHLLKELNKKKIAYVQFMEPTPKTYEGKTYYEKAGSDQIPCCYKAFKSIFNGAYMANVGFTGETAQKVIQENEGNVDLVSFATLFINNPDLPERIKNGWPVDKNMDYSTYFSGGEKGYIEQKPYDPTKSV